MRQSIWFVYPCEIYVMPKRKALEVGPEEEPVSSKINILKKILTKSLKCILKLNTIVKCYFRQIVYNSTLVNMAIKFY